MDSLNALGITEELLLQGSNLPRVLSSQLKNVHLIELYQFLRSHNQELSQLSVVISKLTNQCDINDKALQTKIFRILKLDKGKRGKQREEFRNNTFSVPTSTTAPPGVLPEEIRQSTEKSDEGKSEEKLRKTESFLKERRQKAGELLEKNKQLKRKLSRAQEKESKKIKIEKDLKQDLTDVRSKLKATEKGLIKKQKEGDKLLKYKKYKLLYDASKKECQKLNDTIKSKDINIEALKRSKSNKMLLDEINSLQIENKELKNDVKNLETNQQYLQDLINDDTELILFDGVKRQYTDNAVMCIMNLTDLKVASHKVSPVIQEVASLCGKTPNCLPSRKTVDSIVDRKLSVAQKQVGSVLKSQKSTTLYTDETRKYGKTIETYVLTDEEQNSYVLGLREMFNKSGQCTLDTFKEILSDISTHCNKLYTEEDNQNVGQKLLSNIQNTMSDRASTEKKFNTLLQEYREEILPQVIENWEELSGEEKQLTSRMNNFFCGLHLLVGMADVCEEALKKFERGFLGGKDIGSATQPELKRYHKSESGTLRLLRTCAKCFAVGEDEKNGVSLTWKTYLQGKNQKNLILRFKHNRFNLIFLLGQAVFFHNQQIVDFLDNFQEKSNNLIKAVTLDVKEKLYMAGARALGLISKYITAPLWRLLESPGHILEMNLHFKTLVGFLKSACEDASIGFEFSLGETTPFDTGEIVEDAVLQKLTEDDEEAENILVPMLQSIFTAFCELLCCMIVDHLPEGKFDQPSDKLKEMTESTMKHNKLPEFIFGQLDQMMKYRPNASMLTNESFIMYSHNKTREWMRNLAEDERNKLLQDSRQEGREIRKQFQVRLEDIKRKRQERLLQKQVELERLEKARLQRAENLTNSICYYGLWQSVEQIREGLERLPNQEDKRKSLEAQIKFRKNVLCQKHTDKKIFNFSRKLANGKYVKFTISELQDNLSKLVLSTLEQPTQEVASDVVPLLVSKKVEHKFKEGLFIGTVISVVPGFPSWYNIIYDGDMAVYAYNLAEDYKNGDLKIIIEK